MAVHLHRKGASSLASALALAVLLPCASAILLPIVPLPISFNFGGASPMTQDVACSWGTYVEVDGAKQVRQGCGAARYAWKVVQESGEGAGSEVGLGQLANQQKLTLTLAPNRGQGVLSRSGTYLVQVSISYDKCDREQGQTRVVVGACPSSDDGSSSASFDLQACKDVSEPGKRKLVLNSGSKSTAWQLAAVPGASTSAEAAPKPLSCSGSGCVLLVGSGGSKVHPGRSYAIRYSTGDAAAAAAAQTQGSNGLGFNLGFGGFGFGLGGGAAAAAPAAAASSGGWRELKGPQVDKCPPRITRSAAGLLGSCGNNRWLEMQAAASDLEEGAAGAAGLKFYWYVLSARTQDVIQEASGPSVKLQIGSGQGQLPDGRRYIVKLLVTAQAGGQVSSSKETVGATIDVPAC